VALVYERFVAVHFPGTYPIGRRIRLFADASSPATAPWLTIVGVVPAIPEFGPGSRSRPVVYVPLGSEPSPGQDISVIVRSHSNLSDAVPALREIVRALDPDLPLYAIEPVSEAAARARIPQRLVGTWFGAIAVIGVVLSTLGVYSLTAHGVAQRTHEIGVRVALGAPSRQVVWLFLRRTVGHLSIALVVGLVAALNTGQLLQSLLVQTSARDLLTLTAVTGLVTVLAIIATLLPSWRAARLDPMAALRAE
jgi:putative ABC transport system permease protein